jgi:hypothetical protein
MPLDPTEALAKFAETFSQGVRALAPSPRWQDPTRYFPAGETKPEDPSFDALLERINDDFPSWLDPGTIEAPAQVSRSAARLEFASPQPSGVASMDRVTLKLYRAPVEPPPVVILFHPWLFFALWLPVDWLLAPLVERYRVAVMVAPHHLSRSARGFVSGEGFVNPNPLRVFQGLRQWQADHLASSALLSREAGGAPVLSVGYSLGGYGLLMNRLRAPRTPAVTICVTNSFSRGVFEGPRGERLREGVAAAGFTRERFEHMTRSLHLAHWAKEIGGEDLTWIHARHDDIEPSESLKEAREAIAPERTVELGGGHVTALLDRKKIVDEIVWRAERMVASGTES